MPLVFEYFPPEFIMLQEEIPFHPELVAKLQNQPVNEFEIRMLQVAKHCDIILEGTYQPNEWPQLALACLKRLKGMRPGRTDLLIVKEIPDTFEP